MAWIAFSIQKLNSEKYAPYLDVLHGTSGTLAYALASSFFDKTDCSKTWKDNHYSVVVSQR